MLDPVPDLSVALTAQSSLIRQYDADAAALTRVVIGDLVITSGEFLACDPLGELRDSAFEERFPVGQHRVVLCIAHLSDGTRISAYAMVELTTGQPYTWEVARVKESVYAGMPHQYCVDSGTGCFMDSECLPLLAARFNPADPGDPYRLQLAHQIHDDHDDLGVGATGVQLSQSTGANCVIFETGWGDDWYQSYLGRDKAGVVCCLLTDFGVLDTEHTTNMQYAGEHTGCHS